ncbi:hypothetical protein AAC387_Pa03g4575 [Persea americana]
MDVSLLHFFLFFFIIFFNHVGAQTNQLPDGSQDMTNSFQPSIAVVIGILSILFSLTFLLLMYAKFCHSTHSDVFNHDPDLLHHNGLPRSRSRFSGIDKTVIESLPFFRFSSLKGSRQGLECSVCLSKFEDSEVLRLLPKCKHAFHIDCVDRWLESHSSCPLCRQKLDADDLTIFTYSNSLRHNPSDLRDDPNLEFFIHREPDRESSSRFSSFRLLAGDKAKKDEPLIPDDGGDDRQFLDKFKHRIIVSDVVFNRRWSDVTSSDLMLLNSEMLNAVSSKRFSFSSPERNKNIERVNRDLSTNEENQEMFKIREEMEKKRSLENKISKINRSGSASGINQYPSSSDAALTTRQSEKRSMSEITNLSRFAEFGSRKYRGRDFGNGAKEEKMMRLWLPIARRTVQWFAGRERRSQFRPERPVSHV